MMSRVTGLRGQPLIALAMVLGLWVAGRSVFWDTTAISAIDASSGQFASADGEPDALQEEPSGSRFGLSWIFGPQSVPDPQATGYAAAGQGYAGAGQGYAGFPPHQAYLQPGLQPGQIFRTVRIIERYYPQPVAASADRGAQEWRWFQQPRENLFQPASMVQRLPVHVASAHQLLRMAVLTSMPMPMDLLAAAPVRAAAPAPFFVAQRDGSAHNRWSADSWLLLRRGGKAALATGASPATYGASQAGGVLRYSFAPQSRFQPAAYLRATAALNGSQEREAALGLSARPFPGVPVIAAAELRVTDRPGGKDLRPAAMAVTTLQPIDLPYKARAEIYGQAGYVGGDFGTAFADGQIRVDRKVAQMGQAEVRAGGGAWGGAQKGASRLDAGPTATVGVPIGQSSSARVAVDWRFRLAGNAQPSSGPALTLSAGF